MNTDCMHEEMKWEKVGEMARMRGQVPKDRKEEKESSKNAEEKSQQEPLTATKIYEVGR